MFYKTTWSKQEPRNLPFVPISTSLCDRTYFVVSCSPYLSI